MDLNIIAFSLFSIPRPDRNSALANTSEASSELCRLELTERHGNQVEKIERLVYTSEHAIHAERTAWLSSSSAKVRSRLPIHFREGSPGGHEVPASPLTDDFTRTRNAGGQEGRVGRGSGKRCFFAKDGHQQGEESVSSLVPWPWQGASINPSSGE